MPYKPDRRQLRLPQMPRPVRYALAGHKPTPRERELDRQAEALYSLACWWKLRK